MNYRCNIKPTLFLLLALPLAPLLAQDGTSQKPEFPSDILGPQLVAWSQVQKPQPMQQPAPNQGSEILQQAPPQANSPAAQTFTGMIVKDGDSYILKAAGTNVYQLDDQERAKQYDGKQVKVAGTLDASGNRLHVSRIELLS